MHTFVKFIVIIVIARVFTYYSTAIIIPTYSKYYSKKLCIFFFNVQVIPSTKSVSDDKCVYNHYNLKVQLTSTITVYIVSSLLLDTT